MNNMIIKEKLNMLKKSEMYKEFIEHNPNYELSNIFVVEESDSFIDFQIGFYSKQDKKVVSFDILNHKSSEPQDPFNKGEDVPLLEINKVTKDISSALNDVKSILKEKYSAHNPTKYICIVQKIDSNIIWNITVVTSTLHIIHIKINAVTGEVISDSAQAIMSFAQKS